MSSFVTPQRRSRSVEDNDDISVDGESSLSSGNTSKRPRLDDDEATQDGSLLPDNFRRSPKGKQRALESKKHQPGAIVRVKLTDFVTYSSAEFHPGPNLNMIIGPNGTGKSTLVCAICLGLGFSPVHLGRAKQLGEFVKNGTKKAEIEIELAADPAQHARNPIITTRITRADNKCVYFINGSTATRKALDKLVRNFSIQIDNLCQFLPQDRVVEFSALSPVNLLSETQRAAAPPHMTQWHDDLKAMHKQRKAYLEEQQQILEHLEAFQKRQDSQRDEVNRYREYAETQERIKALEKLRPFPTYEATKQKYQEAKERKKQAERDLRRLERQVQPNLEAEKAKQFYMEQVDAAVRSKARLVDRGENNVEQLKKGHAGKQTEIAGVVAKIEAEEKSVKSMKQNMPKLQQTVRNIQNALATPPEDIDFTIYNERMREKMREIRDIGEMQEDLRNELGTLQQKYDHQRQIMERAEVEKQHSQTQAGQQANKLRQVSTDAAQAWAWIQNNRTRFEGEVFGPPIIECTLKDPRHASAMESVIQNGDLTAFTTTTKEDFKMLQDIIYTKMRLTHVHIRCNLLPLAHFSPPCSTEQMRSMGFDAWAYELIDGPEPVIAMLCDNRNIHEWAVTQRDLSNQQLTALQRDGSPIKSWVTAKDTWQVVHRREYNASSTRTLAIREARFFADAPIGLHEDESIERRIAEAERAMAELQEQGMILKERLKDVKDRASSLNSEYKRLKDEKDQLQRHHAEFAGLGEKLRRAQGKLDDGKEQMATSRARKAEMEAQIDRLTLEKGQNALDFANAIDALNGLCVSHLEAQMIYIEAKSDLEQLQARTIEERRLLDECNAEVRRLQREVQTYSAEGHRLADMCKEVSNDFDEYLQTVYHEIREAHWTPDQLSTEIESLQARLEMNDGGRGPAVLREFEERARLIEKGLSKKAGMESKLAELQEKIKEVKEQWEPQLDALVAHISAAFEETFKQINCAGEVVVHKDDDFEMWAIQIRVKFRCVQSRLHLQTDY